MLVYFLLFSMIPVHFFACQTEVCERKINMLTLSGFSVLYFRVDSVICQKNTPTLESEGTMLLGCRGNYNLTHPLNCLIVPIHLDVLFRLLNVFEWL